MLVYILVIHPYLLPYGATTRLKSSRGTEMEADTLLRTALTKLHPEISEILRWSRTSEVCHTRSRQSSRIPLVSGSQLAVLARQDYRQRRKM